jgi:hypothetical protein
MTRRFMLALLVSGLTVGSAAAHDEYRIIGTIAKLGKGTIAVKRTNDGRTFSMDLKDYTLVTRDKKKVDAAELKVGMSVVVDARGDTIDDLEIDEIRIVPPPKK